MIDPILTNHPDHYLSLRTTCWLVVAGLIDYAIILWMAARKPTE